MKDKKLVFGIALAFIFLASVGFSYAYFSNAIVNNEVKDQVVTTGTLSLRYVDGAEIIMQNIKPGDTITKTVYVANTGTLDAVYNLVWQELTNEIANDEMLIEGTCTRMNAITEAEDGTCEVINGTPISLDIIKFKTSIEPNIIHKYDLTITFKDTNSVQNYNQGKKFSGVLGIEEYKEPNFTTDRWSVVATNLKIGNEIYYKIGDTKEVDLGSFGIHKVRIANTSTPDECGTEGFSQTACGFVLEFEDVITSHEMNDRDTNMGGWPATTLHAYLNNDIYNAFPIDLKNMIIDTTVVSGHGNRQTSNFTSTDKIYLLSSQELYDDIYSQYDTAKDLTRQLDFYNENGVTIENFAAAIKKNENENSFWWLRTSDSSSSSGFMAILPDDLIGAAAVSTSPRGSYGVSPAFRIG